MSNPLAEVFGFPIVNETERAQRYRNSRLCPFHNVVPNCTKTRADDPLGVCSVFHRGEPVITCPVRFREDWLIVNDAAKFFFAPGTQWTSLGEVRLRNKRGGPVGNIDYVLVAYDDRGRVLDFASLEVQAVYISGNLGGPFKTYMEHPTPQFDWSEYLTISFQDFSSSKKQLINQIKSICQVNFSNIKRAIALQTTFFNSFLTNLPEVNKEDSNLAWFLYDLVFNSTINSYNLRLNKTVYTYIQIPNYKLDSKFLSSDFYEL